jgi:hypothetical protein
LSKDEIIKLMEASVDSFCTTLERLRADNEYFYGGGIINEPFAKHVAAARTLQEVRRLADVAQNAGDKFNFGSLQALSERMFELGDSEGGFDYLSRAYAAIAEYRPGGDNTEPILKELCQRDKERTLNLVASRSGGADAPRMVGRFFSACGDVASLKRVFEGFLHDCEELFVGLPPEHRYDWLRDYEEDGRIEAKEIVEFACDLLDEPEVDQATRLLRVLTNLAKNRAELVCEMCCRRLTEAGPILRDRLESLLTGLAHVCPAALAPYLKMLLPLLLKPNFKLRMTVVRMIKMVAEYTTIPAALVGNAATAERAYSPVIAYPNRGSLLVEASGEFMEFVRRGALFYFHERLAAVTEVLRVEQIHVLGFIERKLKDKGWSEKEEEERLGHEYRSHSFEDKHVWFISDFHQSVCDILQEFVHLTVENGRFHSSAVEVLWNVVRGADGEWLDDLPNIKPKDIVALNVNDVSAWIGELRAPIPLAVEKLVEEGWTSVFENKLLTQAQDSGSRFVSDTRIRSLLLSPVVSQESKSWPQTEDWSDSVPRYHDDENITLADFRSRILEAGRNDGEGSQKFVSLVAIHRNGQLFNGHRWLLSLHQTWVGAFNLRLQGLGAFLGDECVAEFETWQEGYEDDVYSRDLLSTGVRLRVKNSFLSSILARSNSVLAVRNIEARTHHESFRRSKEEPDVTREVDRIFFV